MDLNSVTRRLVHQDGVHVQHQVQIFAYRPLPRNHSANMKSIALGFPKVRYVSHRRTIQMCCVFESLRHDNQPVGQTVSDLTVPLESGWNRQDHHPQCLEVGRLQDLRVHRVRVGEREIGRVAESQEAGRVRGSGFWAEQRLYEQAHRHRATLQTEVKL